MTIDLSAFYFDIRKDALYCDPISSVKRKACLTVLDQLFRATVTWLAPMLPFTAEEAWLSRYRRRMRRRCISSCSRRCRPPGATTRWPRNGARCATSAAWSPARSRSSGRGKRIGSSLEAEPIVYVSDPDLFARAGRHRPGRGLHHLGGDAGRRRGAGRAPSGCDDVRGVAVVVRLAEGKKCARSWKIPPSVGADPAYPDVTPRDAQALREWDAMRKAAE